MADGHFIEARPQASVERHNVRDSVLNPTIFRKLELIARSQGFVLQVRPAEDMGNDWGRVSIMAQGVYYDLRTPDLRCYETTIIDIAPRIHVSKLRAVPRPELDWSMIPRGKLWDFLLWHEIGHLRDNFWMMAVQMDKSMTENQERQEWGRAIRIVNEALADRYGWQALFPDLPIPICPKRVVDAEYIEHWTKALDKRYGRKSRERPALTTDPLTHVPWGHVRDGIPYENEAHRKTAMEEMIAARRSALKILIQRAIKAGVGIDYMGDYDGKKVHLGWTPSMERRIEAFNSLKSELDAFGGYAHQVVAQSLPQTPSKWIRKIKSEHSKKIGANK